MIGASGLPPEAMDDFFRHNATPFHVVDKFGNVVDANDRECEYLGVRREDYIGSSIADIHVDKDVIADILRLLLAGERIVGYRARIWAAGGAVRHVLISSDMWLDADGRPATTRCTTVDVDELTRAYERLAQQDRALREMGAPICPLSDDAVVAVVVGTLDGQRVSHLTEALLACVHGQRRRYAIVDITGLGAIDTETAAHLLRVSRAVGLLGARMILTGIAPAVAQTMVTAGVDLGDVRAFGSPQGALEWISKQRGRPRA